MNNFVVYRAHFPNGRVYVGKSRDFATRKQHHKRSKCCPALYNAIKKYGKPRYEIISSFDNELSMNICEMFWIAYHKAKGDCYNIRDGSSEGGGSFDAATLEKMRNNRLGKKHSYETKRKMSATRTGKTHSDSSRVKMSLNHKGFTGKCHTKITRAKMSQGQKIAWQKRKQNG